MTTALLASHQRVVLKPDRSAGGHGLHFVSRGDQPPQPPPPPASHWVVEEYVDHTRAISAQGHATATRVEVAYDGEMRMSSGSFAGYCSPLKDLSERAREELVDWTQALGGHLAAEGHRGPYSLDLVCTQDGTLYALECNVRRTATTTAHAMVSRLASAGRSVWSTGTATAIAPMSFDEAVGYLTDAGLDFQPGNTEGVLLYADRPLDGRSWRYTTPAPTHTRLTELEVRLAAVFGHEEIRVGCPGRAVGRPPPASCSESSLHMRVRDEATHRRKIMTGIAGAEGEQRFCKACGTPAGTAKLCGRCGAVFTPAGGGLIDDEGAAARRVFEGRDEAGPE